MQNTNTPIAYGIDFGTSNSTVSVAMNDGIEILPIEPLSNSPLVLRSVLYFSPDGKGVLFGEQAVRGYLDDIALGKSSERKQIFTGKYIKVDKPIIGDSGYAGTEMIPELIEIDVGDAGRLVQSVKSGLGNPYVRELYVFEKSFLLEEIAGLLLSEIKNRADKIVGKSVNRAVIGMPVNFVGGDNALAIERLTKAAEIAGFEKVIFEYEPLGAGRSYDLANSDKNTSFVFDFGGGTLDFSVIEFPSQKVLINDGMPIGGDYINSLIFRHKLLKYFGGDAKFGDSLQGMPVGIQENLKNWYLISLLKTKRFLDSVEDLKGKCSDPQTMDALYSLVNHNLGFALYEEIDRAKKSLSEKNLESLSFFEKEISIKEELSRDHFEEIISVDLKNISNKIDEILMKVNLSSSDINTVITTGGSSLIPVVQKLLRTKFQNAQIKNQDAFTSVSYGLAKKAGEEFEM